MFDATARAPPTDAPWVLAVWLAPGLGVWAILWCAVCLAVWRAPWFVAWCVAWVAVWVLGVALKTPH